MPRMHFSVKHGKSPGEVRARLGSVVVEIQGKFGPFLGRMDWSPRHDAGALTARGMRADLRVDAKHTQGSIDLKGLGGQLVEAIAGVLREIVPSRLGVSGGRP